ncbi:hypothetical protein BC826DRAFT_1021441 [Russula brevipes]|nr:hypothetical protein BC826DRAFT_1021441 [Russula brevipes]
MWPDPMSQSLLASATAPHASSKHKTIELHNPSHIVEFKSTGTLTFRWTFSWEEHAFEWKREECYLIRKPDPAVLVAITKEVQGRVKTSSVQILDYNLNRFDIADRKGLEITLLTTLLTLQDLSTANHAPPEPIVLSAPMHALRYEPNEVTVNEEGSVENYGEYAEGLLADDAMLFITVRSASPADVPKVKRLRHKREVNAGTLSENLHQYVVYDSKPAGLQRIKLDDPPRTHTRHRRIPMPELHPTPAAASTGHPSLDDPPPPFTPSPQQPPPQVRTAALTSASQERLLSVRSSFVGHEAPPPPISTQQAQAAAFGSGWARSRK